MTPKTDEQVAREIIEEHGIFNVQYVDRLGLSIIKALKKARADERERCAELSIMLCGSDSNPSSREAAKQIADAIRRLE